MDEHGKREAAVQCMVALAEAIERTPVKYEMLGSGQVHLPAGDRRPYSDHEENERLKQFAG